MKSENADKQQITMNKAEGVVDSVSNGTTNSTAASGRKKRSAEQSIKSEYRCIYTHIYIVYSSVCENV